MGGEAGDGRRVGAYAVATVMGWRRGQGRRLRLDWTTPLVVVAEMPGIGVGVAGRQRRRVVACGDA